GPIVQTIFVLRMASLLQRSPEARALDRRLFNGARLLRVTDHVEPLDVISQLIGERGDRRRTRQSNHEVDLVEHLLRLRYNVPQAYSVRPVPTDQLAAGKEVHVPADELVRH